MSSKLTLVRPPTSVAQVAEVNQADLQGEFAKHPSDVLYWGWNLAAAGGRVSVARMQRDQTVIRAREAAAILVEQEVADGTRHRGRGQAPGGMTVDSFEAIIQGDPDVRLAVAELRAAEDDEARIKSVCDALRSKGEMLISLGAHERKARDMGARQQ